MGIGWFHIARGKCRVDGEAEVRKATRWALAQGATQITIMAGGGDAQISTELFWRYQLTKEVAVTPSLQYIYNPALNPTEDNLFAFGLRVRVAL